MATKKVSTSVASGASIHADAIIQSGKDKNQIGTANTPGISPRLAGTRETFSRDKWTNKVIDISNYVSFARKNDFALEWFMAQITFMKTTDVLKKGLEVKIGDFLPEDIFIPDFSAMHTNVTQDGNCEIPKQKYFILDECETADTYKLGEKIQINIGTPIRERECLDVLALGFDKMINQDVQTYMDNKMKKMQQALVLSLAKKLKEIYIDNNLTTYNPTTDAMNATIDMQAGMTLETLDATVDAALVAKLDDADYVVSAETAILLAEKAIAQWDAAGMANDSYVEVAQKAVLTPAAGLEDYQTPVEINIDEVMYDELPRIKYMNNTYNPDELANNTSVRNAFVALIDKKVLTNIRRYARNGAKGLLKTGVNCCVDFDMAPFEAPVPYENSIYVTINDEKQIKFIGVTNIDKNPSSNSADIQINGADVELADRFSRQSQGLNAKMVFINRPYALVLEECSQTPQFVQGQGVALSAQSTVHTNFLAVERAENYLLMSYTYSPLIVMNVTVISVGRNTP